MDGVTDAPETTDAVIEDQPTPQEAEASAEVENFTELNPEESPEGEITSEWLQERYKQMQADYTRKTQDISKTATERQQELEFLEALRSDKETQQAVLEQLQELLTESETETETTETPAAEESDLERQVRELKEAEDQRTAQSLAKSIVTHIEQLAKEAQLELDEDDLKDIFARATAGEGVNNESTSSAFKGWNDRRQALHKKWQADYLKTKQAPTQLPAGQSATETPDLSNRDERIKRMAAAMMGSASD